MGEMADMINESFIDDELYIIDELFRLRAGRPFIQREIVRIIRRGDRVC